MKSNQMSRGLMPWGQAIQVISSSLDHYSLLLKQEEEIRKTGSAPPLWSRRPIRRATSVARGNECFAVKLENRMVPITVVLAGISVVLWALTTYR